MSRRRFSARWAASAPSALEGGSRLRDLLGRRPFAARGSILYIEGASRSLDIQSIFSGDVAYSREASQSLWRRRVFSGAVANPPEMSQHPGRRRKSVGDVANPAEASQRLGSCRELGGDVAKPLEASRSPGRYRKLAGVCDRAAGGRAPAPVRSWRPLAVNRGQGCCRLPRAASTSSLWPPGWTPMNSLAIFPSGATMKVFRAAYLAPL